MLGKCIGLGPYSYLPVFSSISVCFCYLYGIIKNRAVIKHLENWPQRLQFEGLGEAENMCALQASKEQVYFDGKL